MGFNKPLGQAFLIAILAIASFYLLHETDHSDDKPSRPIVKQDEKPSAFISNGEFTIYDKNGRATNLVSKKARYYTNPKRIIIDSPSISFKTDTNQTITLNAQKGTFHPDEETLFLKGEVIIEQIPTASQETLTISPLQSNQTIHHTAEPETWTLKSDEFKLNNQSHFISTDQAVTMTKGKSSIRAIGLNAWIDEKKIELLSEVQGHYVFN